MLDFCRISICNFWLLAYTCKCNVMYNIIYFSEKCLWTNKPLKVEFFCFFFTKMRKNFSTTNCIYLHWPPFSRFARLLFLLNSERYLTTPTPPTACLPRCHLADKQINTSICCCTTKLKNSFVPEAERFTELWTLLWEETFSSFYSFVFFSLVAFSD